MDPTMNAAEEGNDHRPSCNGDRPSWRYWAMTSRAPNPMKKG
jgi:hypothetical protein